MADKLRVRVYNVRFGDAILISVPDKDAAGKTTQRHVLIDVGNVPSSEEGGDDSVFAPVLENVAKVLKGKPLDLYVMTHEHLDHVQGIPFVKKLLGDEKFGKRFTVAHAWITASAAEDYYDRFPDAEKKKSLAAWRAARVAAFDDIEAHLAAAPKEMASRFRSLLANNNPHRTGDCVAELRKLAKKTTFVHRGIGLEGQHPFDEAKFSIWAPEEDASDYYGTFQPMALHARASSGASPSGSERAIPPAGVDATAFYDLIDIRQRGFADNLLAIDKANNNTSVVFSLEWRGWRLLFTGDAELRSWKTMHARNALQPVHFLKVSHHGSHNGTPSGKILDAVLPPKSHDGRRRRAVASTYPETYSGIPHDPTDEKLRSRCTLSKTTDHPEKPYLDFNFAGDLP